MEEVFRFRTLTPLGVQHSTTEDVKLGDFVIPKGTMVGLFDCITIKYLTTTSLHDANCFRNHYIDSLVPRNWSSRSFMLVRLSWVTPKNSHFLKKLMQTEASCLTKNVWKSIDLCFLW